MAKLTKPQRARLEKLATYLEKLPKRYRHFKMDRWAVGLYGDALGQYALHNGGMCGTAACAAGHGPAAGVLVPPSLVDDGRFVNWEAYCCLFVGDDLRPRAWVFNGNWASVDNHHWGAAARIRYLLDHGAPPEEFQAPRLWDLAIKRGLRKTYAPYRIDAKVPS